MTQRVTTRHSLQKELEPLLLKPEKVTQDFEGQVSEKDLGICEQEILAKKLQEQEALSKKLQGKVDRGKQLLQEVKGQLKSVKVELRVLEQKYQDKRAKVKQLG